MKCQDCKYRDGAECRRYPPTHHGYPQVRGDGWCGEFAGQVASARAMAMPVFSLVDEQEEMPRRGRPRK